MGEQKRRASAGHLPPADMVNASGQQFRQLSIAIHDLIVREVNGRQMDLNFAVGCALVVAIDLVRVNAGDAEACRVVTRTLDQRLSKPLEYWGVHQARESEPRQ